MFVFFVDFFFEREYIQSYYNREIKTLSGLISEINRRENNESHEAKQAHETEREELRNKNLEDLNVLKISLEAEIEEYEKQFDEVNTYTQLIFFQCVLNVNLRSQNVLFCFIFCDN